MRVLNVFFVFFSIFCLKNVFSSETSEDEDSDVVVLTNDNFDEFIKKNKVALVEFYAPWCGHCKRLSPEYKKAATELKDEIPLAKVDATVEKDLGSRFEVRGYPTLKLFRDGEAEEYGGGRTADAIVEWIRRMTGPAYVHIKSLDEIKDFHEENAVVYVAHLKTNGTEMYDKFVDAADKNRQLGKFAIFIDKKADNQVHVYRKEDEAVKKPFGDIDDLVVFVNEEYFPMFGPITAETYAAYSKRGLEFVWYASEIEDYQKVSPVIREIAKDLRSNYSFVWLDTKVFGQHATNALAISEFPGLVVQSQKGRFIFGEEVTKPSLLQFLDDIRDGKLKPTIKSEPIPETNDLPVRVIVGNSFKDEIMNTDKDIMLEVYASWCGHCQKLAPIFDELALSLKDNDDIMIAKMDGVDNESPVENFEWSGFPTLFFIKGEGKDRQPMLFDGQRTLEGMQTFIKKHASKPVTFKEVEGGDEKKEIEEKIDEKKDVKGKSSTTTKKTEKEKTEKDKGKTEKTEKTEKTKKTEKVVEKEEL